MLVFYTRFYRIYLNPGSNSRLQVCLSRKRGGRLQSGVQGAKSASGSVESGSYRSSFLHSGQSVWVSLLMSQHRPTMYRRFAKKYVDALPKVSSIPRLSTSRTQHVDVLPYLFDFQSQQKVGSLLTIRISAFLQIWRQPRDRHWR